MNISTPVTNNKQERGRERSKRKKRKCESESKERVNSKKSKTQSKERKPQESKNKRNKINKRNKRNIRNKDKDKNNKYRDPKKKSICMRTNSPSDSDTGSSDSMGELVIEDEDMDDIVRPMNDIYTDQSPTPKPAITPNNKKAHSKVHNKAPQQPNPKTESKLPGRVFAGQLKPILPKSKSKPKPIANKPKSPRKSTLIPIKLKSAIIKSTLGASLSSNNPLVITPLSPRKKDKKTIPLKPMYLHFPQPVLRPKLALQPSFTG